MPLTCASCAAERGRGLCRLGCPGGAGSGIGECVDESEGAISMTGAQRQWDIFDELESGSGTM
jgi:hypothetical protein